MPPDHLPRTRHQFASSIRNVLALLIEVRVDEALVVTAGDKADLLRIGLCREREPVLRGDLSHLGLAVTAQRKQRPRKLFLRESEEEIGLILRQISRSLKDPPIPRRI